MAALSVDGTPMPALPNSADQINYDNTTSGLSATTVKGAVDELASEKQDKSDNSLQTTDKTIVGGINELKSGFTNLDKGYFRQQVVSNKWYKIADMSATAWTMHNSIIAIGGNKLKVITLRYDEEAHSFNNALTKITSIFGGIGYLALKFGDNSVELYYKSPGYGIVTYTILSDGTEGTVNYISPLATNLTDADMDLIES